MLSYWQNRYYTFYVSLQFPKTYTATQQEIKFIYLQYALVT